MAGSIIGVMLPIVAAKLVHTKTFGWFFFVARHFGTGVILSTAFIHLLYHSYVFPCLVMRSYLADLTLFRDGFFSSFIMFGNACIGELHFEPAAAAISLAGLYIVLCVSFLLLRKVY
jgi:zinc transporter 1/2/3